MLKFSPHVPYDAKKVSSTLDHYPSLCGGRNTKSNGVTMEAQLKLIVNLCLGDKLNDGIIDCLDSCNFFSLKVA